MRLKTIFLLITALLSFASLAQPCNNPSKYYYGDTVTICGRVNKVFMFSDREYNDSILKDGHEIKGIKFIQINLKTPISATTKEAEHDVRFDISENNVYEFQIIDSRKLLPDSLPPQQKELKGIFHHQDSEHPYSHKVWFDLVEVK